MTLPPEPQTIEVFLFIELIPKSIYLIIIRLECAVNSPADCSVGCFFLSFRNQLQCILYRDLQKKFFSISSSIFGINNPNQFTLLLVVL